MLTRLCAFVFVGLAVAALPAQASTITYSGYDVISPETVTLSGSVFGNGGSERASAGEIVLTQFGGQNVSIDTFCVDVTQWLQPSGAYTAGAFLTGAFGDEVNALLSHALPHLADTQHASAALQVAIWEEEYGSALKVSGNDQVTGLAATYLDNVRSSAWRADPTMQVAWLQGRTSTQSQAYLAPVPEPATLALLGAGLLGLAAVARRARR